MTTSPNRADTSPPEDVSPRKRFAATSLPFYVMAAGLFLTGCVHEGAGHRTSCAHGLAEAQHAGDCDQEVIDWPEPEFRIQREPREPREYPQGHPKNPMGNTPLGPGSEWRNDKPRWVR